VTLTVSAPVRIAAICGLAAALLIPGGLMFMARSSESPAVESHVLNRHPFGHKTARAPSHATPKIQKALAPTHAKAKPVPRVTPKPSVDGAAVKAARAAGLPGPLAAALGQHETVVVSLYDPYSQVDGISFAEARAGAALANVGFVPLNVLSRPQVGKLTEQLGLLPDPGILVYVRPARLAVKISGFADKETVAQAAQNASQPS
jgi:hypothetical protein